MNIQPLGPSVPSRLEERPTQSATGAASAEAAHQAATGGQAPSRDEVSAAVKKMNDSILGSSQSLQFSIDEDSKDIVVKVIDQSTQEVVRQIPSKEALQIAKTIDKMQQQQQQQPQGLLIDQTA